MTVSHMPVRDALFSSRVWRVKALLAVAVLAAMIFMPGILGSYWLSVLTIALFFATFSVAWDIVFGLSGQVHFGPSLLVALGGYTFGLLSNDTALPVSLCLAAAVLVATLGGVVLALPALRLTGPFLGLVTLAATLLMLSLVIVYSSYTGGERGKVVSGYLTTSESGNYFVALALALIAIACNVAIMRSRVGLILAAIGQSVREVEIVGISATKYKVGVFALSAALSGLGGALLVQYLGSMSPALLLALPVAITILMGAMLGGSGTYFGAAIGAVLLTLINEFARPLGDYRLLIVTAVVWLVVVVAVGGLVGAADRLTSRIAGLRRGSK